MPMISGAPYGTPIQKPAQPFNALDSYSQYHDALSGLKRQRMLGDYISKMNGQNQQPNALSGLNDGINLAMQFHNMRREDDLDKAYRTSLANKTPFQMPEQKSMFDGMFGGQDKPAGGFTPSPNALANGLRSMGDGFNSIGNMAGGGFKAFKGMFGM